MASESDTGIAVRRATLDDVPTLVALNRFVQLLHAEERPDRFKPVHDMEGIEEHYRVRVEEGGSVFFIAEVSGQAAGFLHAIVQRRPPNPFAHSHSRLYVDQLSVDPTHRHMRVGLTLMRAAEALARELGIGVVALDTWAFNRGARRFFEKLGYGETNLRYEKELDPGED